MANELGHGWMFSPGPLVEVSTTTCAHCQVVSIIEPGNDIYLCVRCGKSVCKACKERNTCGLWLGTQND